MVAIGAGVRAWLKEKSPWARAHFTRGMCSPCDIDHLKMSRWRPVLRTTSAVFSASVGFLSFAMYAASSSLFPKIRQ
jgi:hypothetical protein